MKQKKKKSHVPFRMNMLFFIVFLLFAGLILRLGIVQIVHGEDAKREIERTEDVIVNHPAPRGQIYDRNYNLIVGNEARFAITYTAERNQDVQEALETARTLAKIIDQKTDRVTHRDMVDFWILLNPEEAKQKITDADEEKVKDLDRNERNKELARIQRERVTEEDLATLTDEDLEVLAIYRELTSGYALVPQIVKNEDVTMEEFAIVSENLNILPGVDTTIDWNRYYTEEEENTLRSVLGNVSDGLPADNLDYYLSRGYSRNDRVGTSYIEMAYEDVLRGQKQKIKNVTRSGNILETEIVHEGSRGNDIVLTIDMELQKRIDQIIKEGLQSTKTKPGTSLLDRAFIVMMDPNTGEILSMSGKRYFYNEEKNKYEFQDFALGNFTTAYVPGSVVKGATVLAGHMAGVITPSNSVKLDEPIYDGRSSSRPKSSWFNRSGYGNRYLTDRQALEISSNSYMFKTAIEIGNGRYLGRNRGYPFDYMKSLNDMRNYYSQVGLGIRTGIDLPGEQLGYRGTPPPGEGGLALDFAIGQYDTYTPLQLAQYVSTIANGGYRLQPHIVKEIREPGDADNVIGPLAQAMQPKVLNKVNVSDDIIRRVQEGFWGVFHGSTGTGRAVFNQKAENRVLRAAGKTGTAEAFDQGRTVWNTTMVAYAPYENPEVALSVVVPSAYLDGASENRLNSELTEKALHAYFDLKAERANIVTNQNEVENED